MVILSAVYLWVSDVDMKLQDSRSFKKGFIGVAVGLETVNLIWQHWYSLFVAVVYGREAALKTLYCMFV